MRQELKQKIESNLFHSSWPAVEPWDSFPWHLDERTNESDSWKRHSSQALAIDVFGTLKAIDQSQRDVVMNHIAEMLGVPPCGPWQVELEWRDPQNRMKENPNHRTQVDAVALGRNSVIFFECKFAERGLSSCSQPAPLKRGAKRGIRQCSGSYEPQLNPLNQVINRCALSGKGIHYWDFIPELFGLDKNGSYSPCPFAGPAFQWMRNLTVAQLVAKSNGLVPRLAVVYARHPALPMSQYLTSETWSAFVDNLNSSNRPHTISTQDIIQFASQAHGSESDLWDSLAEWAEQKIADGAARFVRPCEPTP